MITRGGPDLQRSRNSRKRRCVCRTLQYTKSRSKRKRSSRDSDFKYQISEHRSTEEVIDRLPQLAHAIDISGIEVLMQARKNRNLLIKQTEPCRNCFQLTCAVGTYR